MTARRLGVSAALVDGQLVAGDVAIDGELVEAVGLPPTSGGRIAAPGLVDIQVNGFAGVDLMAADVEELHDLARALPRHGVTAWLPTLITAAVTDTDRALDRLGEAVPPGSHPVAGEARTLGVHLEGPYLSPRRLGTHPPQHRRDPDLAQLDAWRRRGDVVAVTLAPELPHALELVKALSDDGVLVSLGHSDATAYDAHLAFDAGARTVTHLFNAMSAMRHREPGLPGAALSRPDVVVQMVLDGHHLSPDVVRVVWAAAPDRVVLVTDATAAAGRPDGTYALAGVALDDTVPKLLDGMQALYANVLFERLLRPREEPLFKLDVPGAEDLGVRAAADVALHGAEGANLEHARRSFAECTHLLETVLRVAETWSSCANDAEKLKEFYALAEDAAKELMERATTLRVAATVFRGGAAVTPGT